MLSTRFVSDDVNLDPEAEVEWSGSSAAKSLLPSSFHTLLFESQSRSTAHIGRGTLSSFEDPGFI